MVKWNEAPLEREEQTALVRWIKLQPKIAPFLMKIDNEGKRSLIQGRYVKLMGLLPGASDLFLSYPTKRHHGLYIEVKRNIKYCKSEMDKPSWVSQRKFLETMKSVGYEGHFVYGWEHGVKLIEAYLSDEPMVV